MKNFANVITNNKIEKTFEEMVELLKKFKANQIFEFQHLSLEEYYHQKEGGALSKVDLSHKLINEKIKDLILYNFKTKSFVVIDETYFIEFSILPLERRLDTIAFYLGPITSLLSDDNDQDFDFVIDRLLSVYKEGNIHQFQMKNISNFRRYDLDSSALFGNIHLNNSKNIDLFVIDPIFDMPGYYYHSKLYFLSTKENDKFNEYNKSMTVEDLIDIHKHQVLFILPLNIYDKLEEFRSLYSFDLYDDKKHFEYNVMKSPWKKFGRYSVEYKLILFFENFSKNVEFFQTILFREDQTDKRTEEDKSKLDDCLIKLYKEYILNPKDMKGISYIDTVVIFLNQFKGFKWNSLTDQEWEKFKKRLKFVIVNNLFSSNKSTFTLLTNILIEYSPEKFKELIYSLPEDFATNLYSDLIKRTNKKRREVLSEIKLHSMIKVYNKHFSDISYLVNLIGYDYAFLQLIQLDSSYEKLVWKDPNFAWNDKRNKNRYDSIRYDIYKTKRFDLNTREYYNLLSLTTSDISDSTVKEKVLENLSDGEFIFKVKKKEVGLIKNLLQFRTIYNELFNIQYDQPTITDIAPNIQYIDRLEEHLQAVLGENWLDELEKRSI